MKILYHKLISVEIIGKKPRHIVHMNYNTCVTQIHSVIFSLPLTLQLKILTYTLALTISKNIYQSEVSNNYLHKKWKNAPNDDYDSLFKRYKIKTIIEIMRSKRV